MSIIKHVTLQKIVAHDFRYDPRICTGDRKHLDFITQSYFVKNEHRRLQRSSSLKHYSPIPLEHWNRRVKMLLGACFYVQGHSWGGGRGANGATAQGGRVQGAAR